jgi:hypothetical protein
VKVGESDAYCGMFCLQTEVIPVTWHLVTNQPTNQPRR